MVGGFQVMPRLSAEEFAELEASILESGVQVPISVSADGLIIDGHHRDEIARKHSLHCPRIVVEGDEGKLRSLAFSLNLHRRHLSREQKRQVIAESLKADPKLSNVEHARRTGASDKTVNSVRGDLEGRSEIPNVEKRTDTKGRRQPASQSAFRPRPTDEVVPGLTASQLDELNVPARPKMFDCCSCGNEFTAAELTESPDGPLCDQCLDDDTLEESAAMPAETEEGNAAEADPLRKKGRSHHKRQLTTLERSEVALNGVAEALSYQFDGGFEDTCTSAEAAKYATTYRAHIKRIQAVIKLLDKKAGEEK